MDKAVILLSGGLDSATCLALAQQQGFDCTAISFCYGQRSATEITAAKNILQSLSLTKHHVINIDPTVFGGSALTEHTIDIPVTPTEGIPVTYVPARNTIFLSYALGLAEVIGATTIFIGVNAVDYSGYPDCRPEYIQAFQALSNLATKSTVEGETINVETPLIHLTKAEIIQLGTELGVDYSKTISCYQANEVGQALSVEECVSWLDAEQLNNILHGYCSVEAFTAYIKPNIQFPQQAIEWATQLTADTTNYSAEARQILNELDGSFIQCLHDVLAKTQDYAEITSTLKSELDVKGKALFMPLRAIFTGRTSGPELKPLFELLPLKLLQRRVEQAQTLS